MEIIGMSSKEITAAIRFASLGLLGFTAQNTESPRCGLDQDVVWTKMWFLVRQPKWKGQRG